MVTIILDIIKPEVFVRNFMINTIKQSQSYTLLCAQGDYVQFESKMSFSDFGCLFDLYIRPTDANSVRLTLRGKVKYGIDIFGFAKKRGKEALAFCINNMNLLPNQYRYLSVI